MASSVVDRWSVLDGSVVHGWCGWVEKSNDFTCKMMVLNKLWIPDVLIDYIKDFLYISAAEVLRKYYKLNLNISICNMVAGDVGMLVDIYGRQRKAHWATGHLYGDGDIQMQGIVCMTCGDDSDRHPNINGCCSLEWDEDDEIIELRLEEAAGYITEPEINAESELIPDVGWAIDIPVQHFVYADAQQAQIVLAALEQAKNDADQQIVLDNWNQIVEDEFQDAIADALRYPDLSRRFLDEYDDYDRASEEADYAEYQRECEMEAYEGRR